MLLCRYFRQQLVLKRNASSLQDRVVVIKKFTQDDLDRFTQLTGDTNPIHSTQVPENERMVHGALINAVVAGILGTRLPGPGTIVLSQHFSFPQKCRINKDVEICVELVQNRKIIVIQYKCQQDGKIVFEGTAKLMSPTK